MGQVSTDLDNNISNYWNNFKPQRDIETAKEKEGAGRTVSDIGPRDNPKAPSYLNDTNFSEKINDSEKNSLNKEKVSLIAGSKHWLQTQPLMTEVSTNFSNISSFWNNFKPQKDIETAKEIMNYQQVSDYMKKGSTTPELQSLDRNTSFESNLPKNREEVNFFDTNDKNKNFP